MKFRYYIYYNNSYFILYDRKTKHIHYKCLSFYLLYCYLKKHNYDFNDIYIKSMSLHCFFRDFASFDGDKENV